MDLRRLQHLIALDDQRHFARAAEQAHLSQPAFSRSIQALEREIGQRLFEREAGKVRPTPAGSFVLERARRLQFDARCLQRDIQLYGDSQLGDTAFGVGPFPAATLMPRVLPEFRRRHPQVGLRVEVNNWTQLLEHLEAEDIEFFVSEMRALPADMALQVQSLGRQPGGFYVRAGHPLAGQPCSSSEFWRYGVATTRLPDVVRTALASALGLPAGADLAVALECDDVSLLRTVAAASDTVIGVTDASVQVDVQGGQLVPLQVRGLPPLFSEMGIVSLRNRTPSPAGRRAIELIAAVAGEVNAPPAGSAPRAG
jgi:DNA-binding transcriptional LysR family regulator